MNWLLIALLVAAVSCGLASERRKKVIAKYQNHLDEFAFHLAKAQQKHLMVPEFIRFELATFEQQQFGESFDGSQWMQPSTDAYDVIIQRLMGANQGWAEQDDCQLFDAARWRSILERTICFASHRNQNRLQRMENGRVQELEHRLIFFHTFRMTLLNPEPFVGRLAQVLADCTNGTLFPSSLRRYSRYLAITTIIRAGDEREVSYVHDFVAALDAGRSYLKPNVDMVDLSADEFLACLGEYLDAELLALEQQIEVVQLLAFEPVRRFMRELLVSEVVLRRNKSKKKFLFF